MDWWSGKCKPLDIFIRKINWHALRSLPVVGLGWNLYNGKCKASMAWLYTVFNPTKAAGWSLMDLVHMATCSIARRCCGGLNPPESSKTRGWIFMVLGLLTTSRQLTCIHAKLFPTVKRRTCIHVLEIRTLTLADIPFSLTKGTANNYGAHSFCGFLPNPFIQHLFLCPTSLE